MNNERQDFSRRLADAMCAAGYEPRPAVLFRLFNASYSGRSVSFQTVSRWLGGRALPEQDKLQVLARLFGIEPHLLRFGKGSRIAESALAWPSPIGLHERETINAFLALPVQRRELVAQLVKALSDG